MATNFKYPHSVINSYIADYLEFENTLPKIIKVMRNRKEVIYGTIIGEEMVPEIAGASVAANDYIVFSVQRDDRAHLEYKKHDTIAYTIFTKEKGRGIDIKDSIIDALGRRDFTSDDLETYQLFKSGGESFHFFDIEYNVLGAAEAMNNGKESGYYMGTVVIQYSYTYEMDGRGRRLLV